jgi:hypothetical protein
LVVGVVRAFNDWLFKPIFQPVQPHHQQYNNDNHYHHEPYSLKRLATLQPQAFKHLWRYDNDYHFQCQALML